MREECGRPSTATACEPTPTPAPAPAREHDPVVGLIDHVCDAHRDGSVARMAALAREIATVLPERAAAPEDEYRRVEDVLAEAAGPFLADPTWPERLTETLDRLREHLLEEHRPEEHEPGERLPGARLPGARVGPRTPQPSS